MSNRDSGLGFESRSAPAAGTADQGSVQKTSSQSLDSVKLPAAQRTDTASPLTATPEKATPDKGTPDKGTLSDPTKSALEKSATAAGEPNLDSPALAAIREKYLQGFPQDLRSALATLGSVTTAASAIPITGTQMLGSMLSAVLTRRTNHEHEGVLGCVDEKLLHNMMTMYGEYKKNLTESQRLAQAKDLQALDAACREISGLLEEYHKVNHAHERSLEGCSELDHRPDLKERGRAVIRARFGQLDGAAGQLEELRTEFSERLKDPGQSRTEVAALVKEFKTRGKEITVEQTEAQEKQPELMQKAVGDYFQYFSEAYTTAQDYALRLGRTIGEHFDALTTAWEEAAASNWVRGDLSEYLPNDYHGYSAQDGEFGGHFFDGPPDRESLYAFVTRSVETTQEQNFEQAEVPEGFQTLAPTIFGEDIIEKPFHKSREDLREASEEERSKIEREILRKRGDTDVATNLRGEISNADAMRANTTPTAKS